MKCYTFEAKLKRFFFVQSKLVKDTLRRKERNFQKKKMFMTLFYYFREEVERIWVTFFLQGVPTKRNERTCGLILQRRADQNLFH